MRIHVKWNLTTFIRTQEEKGRKKKDKPSRGKTNHLQKKESEKGDGGREERKGQFGRASTEKSEQNQKVGKSSLTPGLGRNL